MNILAIDTSGPILSVALDAPGGTRLAERDAGTRHSELLMELVDSLFTEAGIKSEDLKLAACMKGPGSFTGLRIGYAAAKGLSLALGIPFAAVPTLDCMARRLLTRPGIVLPAIDAKKKRFYAALYRDGKRLGPYLDAEPENIARVIEDERLNRGEKVILTGPGAETLYSLLAKNTESIEIDPLFRGGNSANLLEIIRENSILYTENDYSGPIYLRKSDAELAAKHKTGV